MRVTTLVHSIVLLVMLAFAGEAWAQGGLNCNPPTVTTDCIQSFKAGVNGTEDPPSGVTATLQKSAGTVTVMLMDGSSFELDPKLTTDSKVTLVLKLSEKPVVVMSTGLVFEPWTWNQGTSEATIRFNPRASSWHNSCQPSSCPSPALFDYKAMALLALDTMAGAPDASLPPALQGYYLGTNAQYFTPFPSYDATTKELRMSLGAPSFKTNGATANRGFFRMFIPNSFITAFWDVTPASVAQATTTMTLGTKATLASLTRSGTTATATTSTAHGYSTGQTVEIGGANEVEYNGTYQVTVTSATTFTYTLLGGTPATPATGTITSIPVVTPTVDPNAFSGGVLFEVADFGYSVDDVAVKPKANTAPTISDIANQAIGENGTTGALAFTVNDSETAAASLTVTGSSSNTTLVPNANIVFGGSGANRTVTVTPAANQTGSATITVTVSDGSLTASDTFTLTVTGLLPRLTLSVAATGAGVVRVAGSGGQCRTSCTETRAASETVRLAARPDSSSAFAGWTGHSDCSDGSVVMSGDRTCTARFVRHPDRSLLDLNADGLGDAFTYTQSSGAFAVNVRDLVDRFTASSTGTWSADWIIRGADFNGDGRSDLFLYNTETGQFFKAIREAAGTFRYEGGTWSAGWEVVVLDLNGDGRSDVFVYNPVTGDWVPCFGAETGFTYGSAGRWSGNWEVYPARLNGDARIDLLVHNAATGDFFACLSDGAGGFSYVGGRWSTDWLVVPSDYTGDGVDDLFLYNSTSGVGFAAINNGSGTFASYVRVDWSAAWSLVPGDFDGNGRADLLVYNATTGQYVVCLSNGAGGWTYPASGTWSAGWRILTSDWNADGRTDLLFYDSGSGTWVRGTSAGGGSFTYESGTFAAGVDVLTSGPRR